MIILRQKQFSPQAYAGVTTAKQAKNIKKNRGMLAVMKRWGHKRNQRQLSKQLDKVNKLGLNEKEAVVVKQNLIQKYNENNDRMQGRMERRQKTALVASAPVATVIGQNSGGTWTKTTTKTTPTTTYQKNNPMPQTTVGTQPQQPSIALPQPQGQQKKGLGTMGKVAIGAGIAAAGYGAYRLIKARKQRQQAEEEQQQSQGENKL